MNLEGPISTVVEVAIEVEVVEGFTQTAREITSNRLLFTNHLFSFLTRHHLQHWGLHLVSTEALIINPRCGAIIVGSKGILQRNAINQFSQTCLSKAVSG